METTSKPFVFVLMPFSQEFSDIYQLGIKDACSQAGAYCERVDEQFFTGSILERIYNQISKADIIVADMTGRNPNVFYETGYAHALGKQVILLTQNVDDIPFDMKHFPHIVYGKSIVNLRTELEKRVTWIINNPSKKIISLNDHLEFYTNGIKFVDAAVIPVHGYSLPGHEILIVVIDIHNPHPRKITTHQFWVVGDWEKDISGEIPQYIRSMSQRGYIGEIEWPERHDRILVLPNGDKMISVYAPSEMEPGSWHSYTLRIPVFHGSDDRLTLRTIGELSQTDITVRMDKNLVDVTSPEKYTGRPNPPLEEH